MKPTKTHPKKVGLAAVAVAWLAPTAAALACPVCGARDGGNMGVFTLVLAMIGVPYIIATVAVRVIRRADRESQIDAGSGVATTPQ